MASVTQLCVYCGSKSGRDPAFVRLAQDLGRHCASHNIGIVYGGGHVGLMGEVASAAMAAGGQVTGIIPEHLQKLEVAHSGLSDLVVVDSMHTRKRLMAERADAFCILPGGLGSLDEAVEIITWKQLRLHDKPIVFLDHEGYWQPFLDLLSHQTVHGFVGDGHRDLFDIVPDIQDMFAAIEAHPEPTIRLAGERL